ncbi:hypothetical protein NHQ30_002502 [Ciborinia camelliae]|nr:hypothetical protein NHQ30_002502 [Ciborinia camelliae]
MVELMRAVDFVIERSPILRTTFLEVQDPQSLVNYAQVVHDEWPKVSEIEPIIGHGRLDLEKLLQEAKDKLRDTYTSIEQNLFGILPVHFGDRRFMVMGISHALYDGGSLPMIHNDIKGAYYGHEITRRPDYVRYLAEVFHSITDEAKDFWKATLWNSPPSIFPKQVPPPTHEYTTHRHEKRSGFSLQEVKGFCSSSNITLQTLGQTCWAFVLAELMGQLDVVFGAVLACRDTEEASKVNFPLFNTVAVRSVLRGTLDQMLRDMQEKSVTTRQFQHFPLRKAQGYALGSRDDSSKDTTIFDTLFTYQGARPKKEPNPLYSSVDGSSDVEFSICVEMEIEDESNCLYWTTACKSVARNLEQTKDIIESLDMILGRIMQNKQEEAITIHPDGISICGFPKFQPRDISRPNRNSKTITTREDWSEIELKLRESISVISGLPEEDILRDSTIFQLGLDSITVLKLPGLLKKHHIHLIASEIMKYLTIHDIANYLSGKQELKQDATIDVDAILLDSMPLIKQSDLDRLRALSGRIEYIMPATAGQKYMIRHWQNSHGSLFYPTFQFNLPSHFDKDRLESAWYTLLSHNDILRTGFYESDTDSTIAQIVYKNPPNKIIYLTRPYKPEDHVEYHRELGNLQSPPLRLFITTDNSDPSISHQNVVMHLVIHHALYDGISISLLLKGLMDLYETQDTVPKFVLCEDRWRTFVATTIKEKNKQTVMDQWVNYLGSAPNHQASHSSSELNIMDESQTIALANEGARRTEVFVPSLPAKRLKQLANNASVSIDHLLIVMASKLFRVRPRRNGHPYVPTPTSNADPNDKEIILGLYLANRFPFSDDLSSMIAPTLNLLPIKITETERDFTTPLDVLAKSVQGDLSLIGQGDMASVGLDEIYEWTGVRVFGWINIVKDSEERTKVVEKVNVNGREKVDEDVENDSDGSEREDEQDVKSERRKEDRNPKCPNVQHCIGCSAQTDAEKPTLLQPVMDKERYARVVSPKTNRNIEVKKDCGAYIVSFLRLFPPIQILPFLFFSFISFRYPSAILNFPPYSSSTTSFHSTPSPPSQTP